MKTNEDLAVMIASGQEDLMLELWDRCFFFIKGYASKWARAWNRSDIDEDDLIQCGYLALCDAVKGFDASRGKFIGYLSLRLKTQFCKEYGCRGKEDALNHTISLDASFMITEDSSATLNDLIADEADLIAEAENEIVKDEYSQTVRRCVAELPEKKRQAVESHFFKGKTYKQIGSELEVSPCRADQIIKEGLRTLRTGKHSAELYEALHALNDVDYYTGTGFQSWRTSGLTVEERILIRKETRKAISTHQEREGQLRFCIDVLGMTREEAEKAI